MNKSNISTPELVLCSFFMALIIIGAFIRIPLAPVPITFQFLFCLLSGLLLGSKLGSLTVLTYLLLGLLGLPIFTQGGGLGYIFQPSFGYLLGFLLGSFLAGFIIEKSKKKDLPSYILASLAFLGSVYLIGLPYLYIILHFHLSQTLPLKTLLLSYCLLFLPNDLLSCFLACLLGKRLKKLIPPK